jgi:hypothetical protein
MVWLILEGVLALLLFAFIIWWTLPRKRDGGKHNDQDSNPTLNAEDAGKRQEK